MTKRGWIVLLSMAPFVFIVGAVFGIWEAFEDWKETCEVRYGEASR